MDNLGASFYKIVADPDFSSEIRVPTEFVKKYGETLQAKMELKTDEQAGKSWNVKSERVGKRCFLTEGWRKFAEDVGLKHGDCVVFTFLGDYAFNVSLYGVNSCKKLPCTGRNRGEDSGNLQLVVKTEDDGRQEMNPDPTPPTWKFRKQVKKYHYTSSRMDIPKRFAVGTGIAASRKMQLVDGRGRRWPVRVTDRNVEMYSMSGGWKHFLIGNKVAVGSTISFQFIPDSGNDVQALLIKNQSGEDNSWGREDDVECVGVHRSYISKI